MVSLKILLCIVLALLFNMIMYLVIISLQFLVILQTSILVVCLMLVSSPTHDFTVMLSCGVGDRLIFVRFVVVVCSGG